MKSSESGLFPFSPDMRNAQIGNPNVIVRDLSTKDDYFIDEVVIPADELTLDGISERELEDFILYWRTTFETVKVVEFSPCFREVVSRS
ncbi:MAG: hypothetical protein H7328_08420 [Bdellovibrio sp.]|nr:hypothetical protein [Bdellovibrio sp.]